VTKSFIGYEYYVHCTVLCTKPRTPNRSQSTLGAFVTFGTYSTLHSHRGFSSHERSDKGLPSIPKFQRTKNKPLECVNLHYVANGTSLHNGSNEKPKPSVGVPHKIAHKLQKQLFFTLPASSIRQFDQTGSYWFRQ
jgi:hypothetical protein